MDKEKESGMFLGVCAYIANRYHIDVFFVRLGVIVMSFALPLLPFVYLLLAVTGSFDT
jgi:phage shock protein PspC (stress-responsive transcriptional regulator)